MERIKQVKEWLHEALAKNLEHRITWRERREIIQKVMSHLSCTERLAKEYVKIASIKSNEDN